MKKLIIYSGRFQPFGKHHYQSYLHLCEKFGSDNVYICTSNKTDENSPLTFDEKLKIIQKYNISKVFNVKEPYKCTELTRLFDPTKTALIFAYGRKDADRLNTNRYFKLYTNSNNLESLDTHGYLYILPHVQVFFNNIELSGTNLRKLLPTANQADFKTLMGWYDAEIDSLFKKSFSNPLDTALIKIDEHLLNLTEGDRITKTELMRIEQYIDKFFKQFNVDIDFQNIYKGTHFFQRLNDPRNETPITGDDLRKIFKKVSIRHGVHLSKLNTGAEGVLKDMETDVNIPFIISWDKENQEIDLRPKTIMKKKDFKTSSPVLAVENFAKTYSKHITHPYEDKTMTCNDMCRFVSDVLSNAENMRCTLKLDGHNFQVTYKNGQVLASRNKSTVVNPLTVDQITQKFEGKDNVQHTFTEAHKAITEFLKQFDPNVLNKIFNNGQTFLNFEIIHPMARNIIDYGNQQYLSLHSLITYNEVGNELSRTSNLPYQFGSSNDKVFHNFLIKITPLYKLNSSLKKYIEYFTNNIKSNFENKDELKIIFWKLGNLILMRENEPTHQYILDIIDSVKAQSDETEKINNTLNIVNRLKQINNNEGIVIEWENRLLKLTGTFGALVPIFGIYNKLRYSKY
jgi:hypothetical protein